MRSLSGLQSIELYKQQPSSPVLSPVLVVEQFSTIAQHIHICTQFYGDINGINDVLCLHHPCLHVKKKSMKIKLYKKTVT